VTYDKAKRKARYEANREQESANRLAYYYANREVAAEQRKARYEDNREQENRARVLRGFNYVPVVPLAPIPESWPYGAGGEPFDRITGLVPNYIPEDLRADIGQELCLLWVEGELDQRDMVAIRRKVYPKHSVLSIHQPTFGREETLGDYIESPDWELPFLAAEE